MSIDIPPLANANHHTLVLLKPRAQSLFSIFPEKSGISCTFDPHNLFRQNVFKNRLFLLCHL